MQSLFSMAIGAICGVVLTLAAYAVGLIGSNEVRGINPQWKAEQWGGFPLRPRVDLLDDGRQLQLLNDFVYLDSRGKVWIAAKDSVINGASIPWAFWSVVGGPLEGPYRNASIVHDEACVQRTESCADVHMMFYEACRAGGVSEAHAKLLYAGVYHFGPQWVLVTVKKTSSEFTPDGKVQDTMKPGSKAVLVETAPPTVAEFEKLKRFVNTGNPSLDDISSFDPKKNSKL